MIEEVNIGDDGWSGSLAVNLAGSSAQGVALPTLEGLPAARQPVGMVLGRASEGTEAGAGVDATTLDRLKADGVGAIISGSATKDGRTVTFDAVLP